MDVQWFTDRVFFTESVVIAAISRKNDGNNTAHLKGTH